MQSPEGLEDSPLKHIVFEGFEVTQFGTIGKKIESA